MSGTYKILLVILLTYAVIRILTHYGVFESGVGAYTLTKEVKANRKKKRLKAFEAEYLDFFEGLSKLTKSVLFSGGLQEEYTYFINRLDVQTIHQNRCYTIWELRGMHISFLITGVLILPLTFFWFPAFIISILCFLRYVSFQIFYRQKIKDEDEIINVNFIDLYLMLYSKLRQGSRARIMPTVDSYVKVSEITLDSKSKPVMLKLGKFLLNNLSMAEDHVAVPKLRERYKSAMIVNFCNVATQALEGVDNKDTLLTFKMDLVRKKTELMKRKAEILQLKAERSIYLIYIILFIFIVVGWYSKLPTGFFG